MAGKSLLNTKEKKIKVKTAAVLSAAFAAFFLTACGDKELESAYDFAKSDIRNVYEDKELMAEPFAADLCVPDFDGDYNEVNSDSEGYLLFNTDTLEIISAHNIYERLYPASTTKIMTCLLALKYGDPDDTVTIPEEAAIAEAGSSMAGIKPGDKINFSDLLYGLMVPSGNDAAVSLACHIAGSEEAFVEMMNEEARSLGATGTHFVNAHGLPDEDHYTTPYDLYLIMNEALKYDEFKKIASTASYEALITDAEGGERTVKWENGNAFLSGKFEIPGTLGITGSKTGHTNAAGFCLVMGEADAAGEDYISVMLKAPSYDSLYRGMTSLLQEAEK